MLEFGSRMLKAIDDEAEMANIEYLEVFKVLQRLKYLVKLEMNDYMERNEK
jgi:hypothetical protein